jgi:hypothetical protein
MFDRMSGCTWIPVAATAALFALASCGGESTAPRNRLITGLANTAAPENTSPAGALRLLEWCWNQQDADRYCGLFPQEYRFAFSALDPYGNAYRDVPWTFEDESTFATHLFEGGHPTEPPATHVVFALDRDFLVQSDPRPGKDPRWHKYVRSSLDLQVLTPNGIKHITGFSGFYLARGDSASVPPCGGPADSLHWYVDRWEDDTVSAGGSQANPSKAFTLGALKALYR